MSSAKYQPVGGRRLEPGWRRLRIDGHLWEFPPRLDPWTGRNTVGPAGIHVSDCPRCVAENTRPTRHLTLVREESAA